MPDPSIEPCLSVLGSLWSSGSQLKSLYTPGFGFQTRIVFLISSPLSLFMEIDLFASPPWARSAARAIEGVDRL